MISPHRIRALTKAIKKLPGSILLLELIRQHYSKKGGIYEITDFDADLKMILDVGEHMSGQIFWYGSYSRDILALFDQILQPGMVVFDVGANIGEITLFVAKRVGKGGSVVSFEPIPELFNKLSEHVAANGMTQVDPVQMGLADVQGGMTIFGPHKKFADGSDHAGLPTLYPTAARSLPLGEIIVTTLDEYCQGADLSRLDVIKIDVEGAELPVLQGGRNTIRRFRPSLIIEVQSETSRAAGYRERDILTFLEDYGYKFHRIARNGNLKSIRKEELEKFQNIIATPA